MHINSAQQAGSSARWVDILLLISVRALNLAHIVGMAMSCNQTGAIIWTAFFFTCPLLPLSFWLLLQPGALGSPSLPQVLLPASACKGLGGTGESTGGPGAPTWGAMADNVCSAALYVCIQSVAICEHTEAGIVIHGLMAPTSMASKVWKPQCVQPAWHEAPDY